MPVSGLASFVTMMLVLVSEYIWAIWKEDLKQGVCGAVPPEALGCLIFELPKIL